MVSLINKQIKHTGALGIALLQSRMISISLFSLQAG